MLRKTRRVKLILPALTEATSPYWRPIKYSLFPPLGLATLAAYLDPDLEIALQDEHVETLDLDDRPRPRRHPGLHHQRLPRVPDRGPLPRARRLRRCSAACTSRRCPTRPRRTPTRSSSVPASTRSRGSCATSRPARRSAATSRRLRTLEDAPADPPRPHPATPLSRPELDRRLARLPAPLHVLLQGRLLRGRALVLHAARRRRARRDRAAAGPPPLLPRRSPARQPALRARAVPRHERDGPRLPGRRDRRLDPARRHRSRRPRPRDCAACSSASRRSPTRACRAPASARTSAASYSRASSGGSTISAS